MDFIVNKETKTVSITKQLDAPLELVWDAYTKPEYLDQWWAPKPFSSRTKHMNFAVGGRRFYAMVSPEGQERWVMQQFRSITPKSHFSLFNAFADADENLELPGSDWDMNFSEQDGKTTVHASIYNESLERLERMIEMGFQSGVAAQLENLDELLANLSGGGTKKMKPAEVSTPSDREVLVKRSFDAPVALVWRAYTEPDLMRRWLTAMPGWTMPVCEMTTDVGGKYRWRWRHEENGQEFGFAGEMLEVDLHSRIMHTQAFDPGNLGESMGGEPSIITVTFDESNGITNVATSIKFASKADRDAAVSTGMTDGMEMSYQSLDALLGSPDRYSTADSH